MKKDIEAVCRLHSKILGFKRSNRIIARRVKEFFFLNEESLIYLSVGMGRKKRTVCEDLQRAVSWKRLKSQDLKHY